MFDREREYTHYWIRSNRYGHDNVAIGDLQLDPNYALDFEPERGLYHLRISNATYDRDNGRFECRMKEGKTGKILHSKSFDLTVLLGMISNQIWILTVFGNFLKSNLITERKYICHYIRVFSIFECIFLQKFTVYTRRIQNFPRIRFYQKMSSFYIIFVKLDQNGYLTRCIFRPNFIMIM